MTNARANAKYAGKPCSIGSAELAVLTSSSVPIGSLPPKPLARFGQMNPSDPAVISRSQSADAGSQRAADELSAGQALDLLMAQGLQRLRGQGGGLVDGFDVVIAHARSAVLGHREKYMPGAVTYGMTKV